MDAPRFDRLAKTLGGAVSRRGALAALLGAGLAGAIRETDGKGKHRKSSKRGGRHGAEKGTAVVAEAADCLSPGVGSNLSGCDFNHSDFSGDNLSSSRMVETTFRDATLVGTNLSSSNAKDAVFRGANLCRADLRSSTLKNTDFRGANLTRADLRSSGCAGAAFNNAIFCGTRTCTGAMRNDHCPPGVNPDDVCCLDGDCGLGGQCVAGACTTCTVCADGCLYDSLADAVAAANDEDTIRLCPGRYHTINAQITKDLTIIGAGSGDDEETDTILDAMKDGRVLTVTGVAEVVMRDLQVTGGDFGDAVFGGSGIANQGTLTLVGVSVVGNRGAATGGGIDNTGTLTLGNGSRVEGNFSGFDGGGIHNETGTTTLEAGSVVTGNDARFNGGGIYRLSGVVNVANTSIVTGNVGSNCGVENLAPPIENCINT